MRVGTTWRIDAESSACQHEINGEVFSFKIKEAAAHFLISDNMLLAEAPGHGTWWIWYFFHVIFIHNTQWYTFYLYMWPTPWPLTCERYYRHVYFVRAGWRAPPPVDNTAVAIVTTVCTRISLSGYYKIFVKKNGWIAMKLSWYWTITVFCPIESGPWEAFRYLDVRSPFDDFRLFFNDVRGIHDP